MYSVQERLIIAAPFYHNAAIAFADNEVVSVRILSLLKDGTVRMAVKGQVIQAKASSELQEGAFLLMKVKIVNNTVLFTPHRTAAPALVSHSDVFSQLGLPSSPLAAVLLDFFRWTELPLHTPSLLKILSQLSSFTPHEKKAAFAAALLYSDGIEPSKPLIEQCFAALFGFPVQNRDSELALDSDFLRFINHVKSGRRHWVVFPFEKHLDILWKGSVAFLLDLHDTICLECCLRFRGEATKESWFFSLKNGECLFSYQGEAPLPVFVQHHLTLLLRSCFQECGLEMYTVRYQDSVENNDSLATIDISV